MKANSKLRTSVHNKRHVMLPSTLRVTQNENLLQGARHDT